MDQWRALVNTVTFGSIKCWVIPEHLHYLRLLKKDSASWSYTLLSVYLPPNILVFHAVREVSKESMRLVLPRTSLFFLMDR
jgi:hypothetical protein